MAINLEAIRKKVNQLNGVKEAANDVTVWKGTKEVGEYQVRILPWKDAPEGTPFHERLVYYRIGRSWMVSPASFGEHDPIEEFRRKLWDSGKEEDKVLAKKLFPDHAVCAAIIDRANESLGPQLWVMNKRQAADVLGFFLDADYGDITDLQEGFDLKVKVVETNKIVPMTGKKAKEVKIECKPRPSPLSADKARAENWMNSLPDVNSYFRRRRPEEVKAQFDEWVNSGGPIALLNGDSTKKSNDRETSRGASDGQDAVDSLARELNGSVSESSPKHRTRHVERGSEGKVKAEKPAKEFKDVGGALDDALADLEDNNTGMF